MDLKIAWRNLMRHRLRTLITLVGVSLSLTLVQTYHNFTQGVYSYMVQTGVRSGAGHLAIYHDHYLDRRHGSLCFFSGSLLDEIATLRGVQEILPRIYLSGLAQSSRENRNVQMIGVDMEKERKINPFLQKIETNIFATPWKKRDALVGSKLLRELKITIGSKFVVTVQNRQGELASELLRVRGVIRTGIKETDNSLVMVDRFQAGKMAGIPNEIHEAAIVLETADLAKKVLPEITRLLSTRPELETVSWEKAMPNLFNALRWDYVSVKFLSFIVLLIVTIGVINTLLMSVMERFHEFGMLRAIGTSPGRLGKMILLEALILGLVSMTLGTFFCILSTGYLVKYGFDLRLFIPDTLEFGGVIFSSILYARWDVAWMAQSAVYILFLCLIASLYPALKASRVTPMEAMRHL
jgi:ABC-type lipoprotein release transport system permease subunit